MNELQRLLSIVEELRRRLIRIAVVILPLFAFFNMFEIRWGKVPLLPWAIAYPWPSPFYNVTAQVFGWMRTQMLSGVQGQVTLLNLGVGDSVIAQMEIGLLLSVAVGMPWIVHEVGAFLMPALRQNERALIKSIGIPATLLFILGFTIGLLWITPFTFLLLFKYVAAMGLAPVLSAESFLEFTLLYTLAFGIVFELPVFVYALSRVGLVHASAWRKHWRGAVIGCLVFGMIITPDNSGITMLLIAIPMFGLYVAGLLAAERHQRRVDRTKLLTIPAGAA